MAFLRVLWVHVGYGVAVQMVLVVVFVTLVVCCQRVRGPV
jgi:hypothetical protein